MEKSTMGSCETCLEKGDGLRVPPLEVECVRETVLQPAIGRDGSERSLLGLRLDEETLACGGFSGHKLSILLQPKGEDAVVEASQRTREGNRALRRLEHPGSVAAHDTHELLVQNWKQRCGDSL